MRKKVITYVADEEFLIKPLSKDKVIFYENKESFGIYSEKGLDIKKFKDSIKN